MKILLLLVTLLPAVCSASSSSSAPAITKTCLLRVEANQISHLYVAALANTGKVEISRFVLECPPLSMTSSGIASTKQLIKIGDTQGNEYTDIIDVEIKALCSSSTNHSFSLSANQNLYHYNGEGVSTHKTPFIAITTKHKDGTARIIVLNCSNDRIEFIVLSPN